MTRATATPAVTTAERPPRGLQPVAAEHSPTERQADRLADATTRQATSGDLRWSFADLPVHPAPRPEDPLLDVRLDGTGQPLDRTLGDRLGVGGSVPEVRIHTDADAADLTRRAGADAVTVGSHVAFAPGRFRAATTEGRRRIVHELAHVAQSRQGPAVVHRQKTGAVTPATTLAGLPEADRKRLQVVSTTTIKAPSKERLKGELFDKGTTIGGPRDTTIAIDPAVPAALHKGLTNLAADWSNGTTVVLLPDTTFTITLDLTAQGGSKGAYRFTFSRPPAAKGKPATGRIIVESLGAPAAPAGTVKPPEPRPGQAAVPDPVADKLKAAKVTYTGYGPAEEQALRAAISQVPATHLAAVEGLTFARAPADSKDPKVAGRYFQKQHRIVMYDKAFAATDVAFVEGGVATSYAARSIVHEIGHAVDLRRLQQAYQHVDTASRAVTAASGKFTSAAQKKTYDDAVKAETAAKQKLKAARSRSGSKTVEKSPGDYEDVIGTGVDKNAFRAAVKKDGKDVSAYGEEDWQESYAEAYSLFVTTPDQLKAIRPATHDYFTKNLP